MTGFENKIAAWLKRRHEDRLLRKFGGIQTCPWCKQIAQSADGWSFTLHKPDPFLDVLKCGVCGGTSLWHFAHGMHYFGPLAPPVPLYSTAFKEGGPLG